jgi:hypothetical protein
MKANSNNNLANGRGTGYEVNSCSIFIIVVSIKAELNAV